MVCAEECKMEIRGMYECSGELSHVSRLLPSDSPNTSRLDRAQVATVQYVGTRSDSWECGDLDIRRTRV